METKHEILDRLKQELLLMQGYKATEAAQADRIGLGKIEGAFPGGVFPKRAIHEFICVSMDEAAATDGFIGGLLSVLMNQGAGCIWIGTQRKLFPSSLAGFGVEADRIIFIDVNSEKEVLWIMEESLRCEGLCAVIAEVNSLSLVESRRLQLAVEKNGIPAFIIRKDCRQMASTVSAARWRITPMPSGNVNGMPGVGFPRWQVELMKVRSGIPGSWMLEWQADHFEQVSIPAKEELAFIPLKVFG